MRKELYPNNILLDGHTAFYDSELKGSFVYSFGGKDIKNQHFLKYKTIFYSKKKK